MAANFSPNMLFPIKSLQKKEALEVENEDKENKKKKKKVLKEEGEEKEN